MALEADTNMQNCRQNQFQKLGTHQLQQNTFNPYCSDKIHTQVIKRIRIKNNGAYVLVLINNFPFGTEVSKQH